MAIRGQVSAEREPIIEIAVGSRGGNSRRIAVVVDTGFTGYLTLPLEVIIELELQPKEVVRAQLADGSYASLQTYAATVRWHDAAHRVVVCHSQGGPLLGMALLAGSRLSLDAVDGGAVLIEELER